MPAVPLAADKGGNYSEEEVRALRSKGIEAEKGDKWEEATEAYSHALELWYDGNKGEGGRKREISDGIGRATAASLVEGGRDIWQLGKHVKHEVNDIDVEILVVRISAIKRRFWLEVLILF